MKEIRQLQYICKAHLAISISLSPFLSLESFFCSVQSIIYFRNLSRWHFFSTLGIIVANHYFHIPLRRSLTIFNIHTSYKNYLSSFSLLSLIFLF